MRLSELKEYQDRLVQHLERTGLSVSFGNDLSVLLQTYAVATGTGYIQLPFVVENPKNAGPFNFWVCFDDGNEPMALTGYRTVRNGGTASYVGEAFSKGALYTPHATRPEGWWPRSGPTLAPHALYGYIGAGWVHPRFRGQNLAGYIARIAQAEAILRTKGTLSLSTAMTVEALFRSGMNIRASGLHHLHVEQVLDGYFRVIDKETRLYLSHSTTGELCRVYREELDMLRSGEPIPWLDGQDKSFASDVLADRRAAARQQVAELAA